jgi:RNA polymerase sigma factor (sigma-70 family)
MNDTTDEELIQDYARHGSEAAFTELVRRHTDLVYSTAARLVVDRHLAEDVSQRVFVALAQNAHKLANRATISGWLHRTTHSFSVMTIRTEERRRAREQKAAPMLSDTSDSNSVWECVAPHLDDALNELNDNDRDLVVLRFFERKTAREMGTRLGLSEEAAQKRTTRALERLRAAFRSRGIVLSAAALAGAISLQSVQSAPTGLAAVLATKTLAETAVSLSLVASIAKGLNVMAQIKSHPVAAAVAILACLSLGTTGFVTGKKAATKHQAAAAWQQALLDAPRPEPVTARAEPATEVATPAIAQRSSVREILQEAAQLFRSQDTDPDAWAKGIVVLEKLRPDEAVAALRELDAYQAEPVVFRSMVPSLMRLWAQTDPRAALAHSLSHFKDVTLGIALQGVASTWARQEPEAAWAWYRETTDSGKKPIGESSWGGLAKPIFTEWAARDTTAAFDQLAKVNLADEGAAISGIADAVKNRNHRADVLAAIAQMPDDARRHRLAAEVASQWAKIEPQSAAEWSAGIVSENPAVRLHAMSEAFEEWWRYDPRPAAVWMLTQAPGELRDQFRNLVKPDQFKKLLDAAK